jgi:hypothetical protein
MLLIRLRIADFGLRIRFFDKSVDQSKFANQKSKIYLAVSFAAVKFKNQMLVGIYG